MTFAAIAWTAAGTAAAFAVFVAAFYWLTRDKGSRAAPRRRTWPQRPGTLRACLRRAHLPRRAAQARTWAQHAITQRIRRTPPPRHAGCREPFSAWESDTFVNGLTAIKGDE